MATKEPAKPAADKSGAFPKAAPPFPKGGTKSKGSEKKKGK